MPDNTPNEDQRKQQEKQAKEQTQQREQAAKSVPEPEQSEDDLRQAGLDAAGASLKDYDPSKLSEDEKIVETNNHASMTSKEYEDGLAAAKAAASKGSVDEAEGQDSVAQRVAGKTDQPQK